MQFDPDSGIESNFGNLVSYPVTATAFDASARRLFTVSGTQLQILDLNTRQIALISMTAQLVTGLLEWDPGSLRLLSVEAIPAQPFVTIDPETGVVAQLIVTAPPSLSGLSALDVAGRRLFVSSYVTVPGVPVRINPMLHTLDLVRNSLKSVSLDANRSYGALEFVPGAVEPAPSIPTLDNFGAALLLCALAVLGANALRRAT